MKQIPLFTSKRRSTVDIKQQLAKIILVSSVAFLCAPSSAQTSTDTPAASATAQATPIALRFSDFFKFPVSSKGLEMSTALLQAQGKNVTLTGYMVQQENGAKPGQFLFTPRPVQMSEHADGDADDLPPATVLVKLAPEQAEWVVPHTRGLIQLQGRLSVGRQEGADGRVTWVQLQLNPDATRGMNTFEFANYLHSLQHRH